MSSSVQGQIFNQTIGSLVQPETVCPEQRPQLGDRPYHRGDLGAGIDAGLSSLTAPRSSYISTPAHRITTGGATLGPWRGARGDNFCSSG